MKKSLISLAILSAMAASAYAQDDTMVITASGYEQKLTNAPASISVINQQELQTKITAIWVRLSAALKG